MRYEADKCLNEKVLEVLRHFQVINDDRRSQKPNISLVSMIFHDLAYPSIQFLSYSSLFYYLLVNSLTCFNPCTWTNMTSLAHSYHFSKRFLHLGVECLFKSLN